jgi:hypothetical protein
VCDGNQHLRFDRGTRIGELAQAEFPGGVLIDVPHTDPGERVAATKRAIAAGAPAIFEASVIADEIFVAVDVLARAGRGHTLIEVKSTVSVKEQHLADVAVQLHVLRRAGLTVRSAEVMHLNRDCRYPDLSDLFVRERVTQQLAGRLKVIPREATAMKAMLVGAMPDVAIGPHCDLPYTCPFKSRCWPALPAHHISTLYAAKEPKLAALAASGVDVIDAIPADFAATAIQGRQIRSVKSNAIVVERGLRTELAKLTEPIAYLDFETIAPAVPAWPGCGPYQQVPVQFSCHVVSKGTATHHEWLADGPADPRESLGRALIAACAGAKTVVAYNAPFEKRCITGIAEAFPALRARLAPISARLRDLLPIVRNHVYHPAFGGGFGLKAVLPALVPDLGYDDLDVSDGQSASALLEALIFDAASIPAAARSRVRTDLLAYCARDTLGLVKLVEALDALAGRR